MKKKIAWITDSVSCISPETAKELDIFVAPCSIIMNDEVFRDGLDITAEEFYERLGSLEKPPTTSQPSVGEFAEMYEKIKEEYEIGIAVHVSSKISGTINGSRMGADIAEFPLHIVDSKTGVGCILSLIQEGKRLEQEGLSASEIATHLQTKADKATGYILVGNLEQLKRSGRISSTSFFLGSVLQLKPLLKFVDGELLAFDKIRGTKKAENKALELLNESLEKFKNTTYVNIIHSSLDEKAIEWKKHINEKFPHIKVTIDNLSPAIGVHCGKETIGLLWLEE